MKGPFTAQQVRQISAVLLAVYSFHVLRTANDWHLLDFLNLPIHETGHLLFSWGGETIGVLGGTLFQLIIPLTFVWYFRRRGDQVGAAATLWWAGQNGFNIAVYVSDARAQALPLVGGGEHDWTFLLGKWGLLQHDQSIGIGVRIVALITMSVAVRLLYRSSGRA
jgi:hypothetical protein